MSQLGKTLILFGVGLIVVGGLIVLGERLGLGRLPGDIVYKGKQTEFQFPIVSCLVVSVVLSVILNLWLRSR
ncbi:MAG TPA: DUF2905 domain-containing protein [Polyangiaceae bacterium]|jgi:hypothetical protein|nr:DUF2905 domain-containing protein [Polyangiaceae bacterium]